MAQIALMAGETATLGLAWLTPLSSLPFTGGQDEHKLDDSHGGGNAAIPQEGTRGAS